MINENQAFYSTGDSPKGKLNIVKTKRMNLKKVEYFKYEYPLK